jgi:hypothetical protein
MIAEPDGAFRFFVEGADDFHAILGLLARHELSRETLPQKFPKFRLPGIEDGQGREAVLRAIETAVKANSSEPVGLYSMLMMTSAQAADEENHGRQSSKVIQDCTICVSCRRAVSGLEALK